jgi:membrane-bound ClpP family serine protease
MDPWVWAVLLLAFGLALAVLEVFVPSGGVLVVLSGASLIGAIVLGFMHGPGTGVAIVAVAVLGVPAILVMAFRWWPYTPVGRRVLLGVPRSQDVLPDSPKRRDLKGLVDRVGKAKSQMLLSGAVVIDGRTYDAVSEALPIEAGQTVRVVQVRGTEVVVRPVREGETTVRPPDDPLSQPIDTVVPDPFEEPPA